MSQGSGRNYANDNLNDNYLILY